MTGPELLDAVLRVLRCATGEASIARSGALLPAVTALPRDTEAQLRALLRTPEETAALRAAIEWREALMSYLAGDEPLLGPEVPRRLGQAQRDLMATINAIPEARRAEIMVGEK